MMTQLARLVLVTMLAGCGADSASLDETGDPPAPTDRVALAFQPPRGARWTFERTGTVRMDERIIRGVHRGEVTIRDGGDAPALAVRVSLVTSTESGTTTETVPQRTGGDVTFVQRYDRRGQKVGRAEDVRTSPGAPLSAILDRNVAIVGTRGVGSAGLTLPEEPFTLGEELTTELSLASEGVASSPSVPGRCRTSQPEDAPGSVRFVCEATVDRHEALGSNVGTMQLEAVIDRPTGVATWTRTRWDLRSSLSLGGSERSWHEVGDVTVVLERVAAP